MMIFSLCYFQFPEKTVALVAVFPKYGQSQVLWNHEVCLNEEDVTVSCVDLTSWFDPSTGKVDYITSKYLCSYSWKLLQYISHWQWKMVMLMCLKLFYAQQFTERLPFLAPFSLAAITWQSDFLKLWYLLVNIRM